MGTRPRAVVLGFGVGVGVEIKVCFLPFHVAWAFGLDGRDTPSQKVQTWVVREGFRKR